jgi:hypothetical protein
MKTRSDTECELFGLPAVCLLVEVEEEDKHERIVEHHQAEYKFWVVAVVNE